MYTIDFETYSEAGYYLALKDGKLVVKPLGIKGGLPEVGIYPYVEHPSFEVLCMHYRRNGSVSRLWRPSDPHPPWQLLSHVHLGGKIEAHNSGFEYTVWNVYCAKAFGWPELQIEQMYCSAAKCRRHSLPGALGLAQQVVGGTQKDKNGSRLIQKLTRPHTPTKNRPCIRWTPETAHEDFRDLYKYCATDTEAEQDLSRRVPDLTERERGVWLVDQRINQRGVLVDRESLDACVRLLNASNEALARDFRDVTGGEVGSVNENAKFLKWLASRGALTESVDKKHVAALLAMPAIRPDVKRALELRQALGGANNKKLITLDRRLSKDNRLRSAYMYCGADRTGRFSSGGVQLQNITANGPETKTCAVCDRIVGAMATDCPACGWGGFKERGEWDVDAADQALADIRERDRAEVSATWGDVGKLLSGCLRGLFIGTPSLTCVDFSAVEAVVLACLSRCQWRVDVFSTHGKIYETTASQISGVPLKELLDYPKDHNGQPHPHRKKLGKIPELASGYGGWIKAWKAFGADKFFDSDDEIAQAIVTWRERSPEIVAFWGGQHRQVGSKPWNSVPELYGLEGGAVSAIREPGQWFQCIDIWYIYGAETKVLYCRLPSGRFLHYHRARLVGSEDHFRRPAWRIVFEGYNSNPAKGPVGWTTMETYGGRLAENVAQATAADIQTEAMVRADAAGYAIVMHTHDEITVEGDDLPGLTAIMTERPTWAYWWPIRAAGWTGHRYRKG